jgi:hypothetical protein
MHEKLLKGRHFCSKLISFSENQTKAGFSRRCERQLFSTFDEKKVSFCEEMCFLPFKKRLFSYS